MRFSRSFAENKGAYLYLSTVFLTLLCLSFLCGYYSVDVDALPSVNRGGEAQPESPNRERQPMHFLPNIDTISWSPRAQVYHNFLLPEECERIIRYTEPKLERSLVVDPKDSSKSLKEKSRTSSGAVLSTRHDVVLKPIIDKAARQIEDWVKIPSETNEQFYVLRYELGQQYEAHTDFYKGPEAAGHAFLGTAGDRVATVLVYLHTPEEGGQTYFPEAGVGTNATAGTALLFWDYSTDFEPDWRSLHAGMPVLKGVKWSMTRWIRMRPWRD